MNIKIVLISFTSLSYKKQPKFQTIKWRTQTHNFSKFSTRKFSTRKFKSTHNRLTFLVRFSSRLNSLRVSLNLIGFSQSNTSSSEGTLAMITRTAFKERFSLNYTHSFFLLITLKSEKWSRTVKLIFVGKTEILNKNIVVAFGTGRF